MRAWNDLEGVELPEWARFVATDLGGFRYCYPERPVAGYRIWHRGGDPLKQIDTVNLGGSDWRDTLIDLEEYRAARQEQTRAKIMAEFKVEPAPDATTAPSILQAAIQHMEDRAATYDQPGGERSMGATVAAFRAVAGVEVTEEQGWLFMALLKAVRSQQGAYRADSYEDGAAYFALAGESAGRGRRESD